jgi:hypothetical protein
VPQFPNYFVVNCVHTHTICTFIAKNPPKTKDIRVKIPIKRDGCV